MSEPIRRLEGPRVQGDWSGICVRIETCGGRGDAVNRQLIRSSAAATVLRLGLCGPAKRGAQSTRVVFIVVIGLGVSAWSFGFQSLQAFAEPFDGVEV